MKLSRHGLRRRLDVEPLSDARWARVERAVLDASAEGGARPRDAAAIATPAAPRWRPAAAMLVLAGALAAIAGGIAWRALTPESREGATRVETAAIGSRVEFGESTIDVGPTSTVRLAGDASHGVVVTLDQGRVECDVAPRLGRPPYIVEAGSVEVRVVGTHFVVSRAGDAIAVDVQRGEVEVTSNGERSFVNAGAHWPAPAPASATPPPVPVTSAPPSIDPPTIHAVPVEPRSSAPQAPRASGASPREQYEAASKLEAQQPEEAIALYRDLARQGGSWGENALFAAGRLEADQGDRDIARHLLRSYLSRFPAGPNANDARQLLDRLR